MHRAVLAVLLVVAGVMLSATMPLAPWSAQSGSAEIVEILEIHEKLLPTLHRSDERAARALRLCEAVATVPASRHLEGPPTPPPEA